MIWQVDLPDSDLTVLVRVNDPEWPLALGFHDGECWRDASAERIEGDVLGWMDMTDGAEVLDDVSEAALEQNIIKIKREPKWSNTHSGS